MNVPGANDPQFSDFATVTNGAESLAFATVLLPQNFLGDVEVSIQGQVTDLGNNEVGTWKARLRQQVSRNGSAGWVALTGLTTVSGYSFSSPIAVQFSNSFATVQGDEPGVWKLLIQGVGGQQGSFSARVTVSGTIFDV